MVFMTLDIQGTLHVLKNKALVFNIRAGRKASTGGIDGCQTGMPASKYLIFHLFA